MSAGQEFVALVVIGLLLVVAVQWAWVHYHGDDRAEIERSDRRRLLREIERLDRDGQL